MEVSETRNLVRDLDLTLQPRIVPRYKTWLPLATQQVFKYLHEIITLRLIDRKIYNYMYIEYNRNSTILFVKYGVESTIKCHFEKK